MLSPYYSSMFLPPFFPRYEVNIMGRVPNSLQAILPRYVPHHPYTYILRIQCVARLIGTLIHTVLHRVYRLTVTP